MRKVQRTLKKFSDVEIMFLPNTSKEKEFSTRVRKALGWINYMKRR